MFLVQINGIEKKKGNRNKYNSKNKRKDRAKDNVDF